MDRPQLGYYRIEGIVGTGRAGIVYLATDSRSGRAVALKVLREDVSIDPVYRERFRREARLGGSSTTCAYITAASVPRTNGTSPVRVSIARQVSA